MEKAYAKRWLVLAGAVLVAALLLAALVAGPVLAHGRFGQTSPGGWRHGGMMGGRGYGGWAKASSPSNERHGMVAYHGIYLPWQGEAGEGRCPGWAYTPNWTGVECPAVDASEHGNRGCPGWGDGLLPVPGDGVRNPTVVGIVPVGDPKALPPQTAAAQFNPAAATAVGESGAAPPSPIATSSTTRSPNRLPVARANL